MILYTGRITGRPEGNEEGKHTTVLFGKKKSYFS